MDYLTDFVVFNAPCLSVEALSKRNSQDADILG